MYKLVGEVLSLHLSKPKTRLNVKSIAVDENGVIDDKFYGKDINRSILVTSLCSYDIAKEHEIELNLGELGENIVMDFNLYTLKPGEQFKIGSVVFEIAQNCTICKGLAVVDKKLPKLLKDGRGIFVKAVTSGQIDVSDGIYVSQ